MKAIIAPIALIALAATLLTSAPTFAQTAPPPPAARLAAMINAYRAERGLPAIALSPSLTRVAEAHAQDLESASPRPAQCNLHSWSGAGRWTSCCYTDDHARAACMWAKPRQITGGAYPGDGFEIAHSSSSAGVTPESALSGWQASPGHHDVMLNRGVWASMPWRAMGVAVTAHHALVWFGKEADPAGPR
jgi:Cysteine-rich secretory protein family